MADVLSPIDPLRSQRDDQSDWRAKYNEAADMLSEARNELDDFVHSSKELEEELLRELERNEKIQKDLKDRVSRVEMDRDEWKNKFIQLQTTHNTATNSLNRELDTLRKDYQTLKVQLRDLEMGNDDLERTERAISSSLADMEAKYARVLEEKIILEQELLNKAKVEEEAQRLRDDMRDANSEIQVLRDQLDAFKAQQSRGSLMTPPTTDSSSSPPRVDNSSTTNLPLSNGSGDDSLLDTIVPQDVLNAADESNPSAPPMGSRPLSIASSNESNSSKSKQQPTQPKIVFPKPGLVARVSGSTGLHSRSNSLRASPNKNASSQRGPRTSQTSTRSALPAASKSKGVQMVSEMRARVRNLEQKLHTRVPRLRSGTFDKSSIPGTGNGYSPNPAAKRAQQQQQAPESPGWVLVMEDSPPPRRVTHAPRRTNSPPPTAFPLSRSSNVSSSETDSPISASHRLPQPRRSFTRSNASSTHTSSIPTPSTSRPSSPDFGPTTPVEARNFNSLKRTSVPVFAGRASLGSSTDSSGGLNLSQRSSSTVGKGSMGPPPVPSSGKPGLSISQLGGRPPSALPHPQTTPGPRGLSVSALGPPTGVSNSLRRSNLGQSRIGRPLSMSARRTDTGPAVKGLPVDEFGGVIEEGQAQGRGYGYSMGGRRVQRSGSVSQFGASGETF